MSFRIVQIHMPASEAEIVKTLIDDPLVVDKWCIESDSNRISYGLLVRTQDCQALTDKIQTFTQMETSPKERPLGVEPDRDKRLIILPAEATLPRLEKGGNTSTTKRSKGISREEIYAEIARGAQVNKTFFLLVFFSTIVAAIGLIEDSVAVVIGAMVIAPLLGPNLALALATALGDRDLFIQSVITNVLGVSFCLALSCVFGFFWPHELLSKELLARTDVGFDGIVLAIASGAAAVLSLTTGLSSVLVGVMVAVALLPPAVTMGLMLGAGKYSAAWGAGFLLAVNIVCLNLSAKLVFFFKGVAPLNRNEKASARWGLWWYILFWMGALLILAAVIYFRQKMQVSEL